MAEALAYFFERATAHARNAGYVHEQIALLARQRRAWAPHLARTREFIERVAATTARRQVVVLGSGALLDIPIAALAQHFRDVVLIDVFHPRVARRTARRFANVRPHTCDLLGAGTQGNDRLPRIRLDAWRSVFPAPDLVVSANLLSQLPILPLQRAGAGDDAEIDCFDGLAGADIPEVEGCWIWEIAPFGEIDRNSRTVVDVCAFRAVPA
ncbi:MAG: hypothetical protein EXQ89_06655 [Rhodospirillaceae bacterium]|nr:hypothetical protein [Rhodospirillaceae bacterium]